MSTPLATSSSSIAPQSTSSSKLIGWWGIIIAARLCPLSEGDQGGITWSLMETS
jgi:hypothetical protein